MKALFLPANPTSILNRILREHYIDESTNTFMMNLSRDSGVTFNGNTEIQAQLHLQFTKIFLDNLYKYLYENRLHEFVVTMANRQLGAALYIKPTYATEILSPIYGPETTDEEKYDIEQALIYHYSYRLCYMYGKDIDRFNNVAALIMEQFVSLLPSNIQVLRFELSPTLVPMVCYTDKEQVMQLLTA